MGLTSLQVCMDSSDWFQGGAIMHNDEDESGMGSPSDMELRTNINNNMNIMDRRLRPPHDQALKCPRCDSAHTKFCYYNNYSLSQPRYFCKTCRRYWTKGGSLRNIPVGGACRKAKKPSSKKPDHHSPTDLHISGLLNNFMETKYNANANANAMLNDNHQPWPVLTTTSTPIDFMMMGQSSRNNYDHHHFQLGGANFNNLMTSPFGTVMMDNFNTSNNNSSSSSINVGGSAGFADSRLMLPYEDHHDHQNAALMDVKPKLLSLQWHDHQQQQNGCTENTITPKDSFGYLGVGSWSNGMINAYGSSTTNPLI